MKIVFTKRNGQDKHDRFNAKIHGYALSIAMNRDVIPYRQCLTKEDAGNYLDNMDASVCQRYINLRELCFLNPKELPGHLEYIALQEQARRQNDEYHPRILALNEENGALHKKVADLELAHKEDEKTIAILQTKLDQMEQELAHKDNEKTIEVLKTSIQKDGEKYDEVLKSFDKKDEHAATIGNIVKETAVGVTRKGEAAVPPARDGQVVVSDRSKNICCICIAVVLALLVAIVTVIAFSFVAIYNYDNGYEDPTAIIISGSRSLVPPLLGKDEDEAFPSYVKFASYVLDAVKSSIVRFAGFFSSSKQDEL